MVDGRFITNFGETRTLLLSVEF